MINTLIFVIALLIIAVCGAIRFNGKMGDEVGIVVGLMVLGACIFFRFKWLSMFPFSLIGLLGIVAIIATIFFIGD